MTAGEVWMGVGELLLRDPNGVALLVGGLLLVALRRRVGRPAAVAGAAMLGLFLGLTVARAGVYHLLSQRLPPFDYYLALMALRVAGGGATAAAVLVVAACVARSQRREGP